MAKVKIKLRASSVEMKEGTLYYQVTHNRVVRQVSTDYRLYPSEWDADNAEIILPSSTLVRRHAYLLSLRDTLGIEKGKFSAIILQLEREGKAYTSDDIVSCYRDGRKYCGMVAYTGELITNLRKSGRLCMVEKYTTSLNSFLRYLGGKDVSLSEIDGTLMQGYESYLKETGVCRNTASFYMRNLRAVYNHAVDEGIVTSANPFKHVYTGIDKTVKRAVSLDTIKRIKNINLDSLPMLDYARDMFLFSFYTRGMSFIDMAGLKKKDLRNGILCYRRQKTSQQLFIKWERPMQEIVCKYDTKGTPYLLPISRGTEKTDKRQYKKAYRRVNKWLKKLGERLELPIPLTTYVARHSWASIAKSKNIPISVISEALGHDSEKTTRIYLASLDTSSVDKANRLVLKALG